MNEKRCTNEIRNEDFITVANTLVRVGGRCIEFDNLGFLAGEVGAILLDGNESCSAVAKLFHKRVVAESGG